MALKKACVQMWNRAIFGNPRPKANIIRPSWLVVEYAMIFFISCWRKAEVAANMAVVAPTMEQASKNVGVFDIFVIRISKNIPATTIVEL